MAHGLSRTVVLSLLVVGPAVAGDDPALFTLQILPGTGDDIRVFDLNESGVAVGYTRNSSGEIHGAVWENGTLHPLGALQDDDSWYLTGINDDGHMVGVANLEGGGNPNNYIRAFRWIDANGDWVVDDAEITLFHPAGPEEWSEPTDIGNGGHVCGIVDWHPTPTSAFVYDGGANIVAPLGSDYTESWAVNDSGAITGNYWSAGAEVWRAYRSNGGVVTTTAGSGGFITQGNGINDQGQVVGWAYRPDWTYTGFVWLDSPAYGLPAGFHELPGHDDAWANDINESGIIVGYGYQPEYTGYALAWVPNGDGTYTEHDLQAVADGVPANWVFSEAIAINDSNQILVRVSDTSQNEFRAALLSPAQIDSDEDGLLDDWEENGIPYTDSTGAEVRFLLDLDGDGSSDADPMRKDLFVEVDAMSGHSISPVAIAHVQAAFSDAPVPNPNQSTGITLHVLFDDSNLPHVETWATTGCWPNDYSDYADNWYGSAAERESIDDAAILTAKDKAFRYCIVADKADSDTGGCGEMPGSQFVIFLGDDLFHDGDNDDLDQAALFMHELGHNLGLDHGGQDSINGKANYPSIMNYVLTYKSFWNDDFWRLDFCRVGDETLDELAEGWLEETVGIGTAGGFYADFRMPFGVNLDDDGEIVRTVEYVHLDGSFTDFGDLAGTGFVDGSFDEGVSQDLNYVTADIAADLPTTPSPGEIHVCHNDWDSIVLATPAALGAPGPVTYPEDELTITGWRWMNENFPEPPADCPADLDGDAIVGFGDLLGVLSAWGPCGAPCPPDIDGDLVVGFGDLLAVLSSWGPCP